MKTTIEISDPLLAEARKLAAREGVTLRLLMEQGLRTVISQKKSSSKPFKLRKAAYKGKGLQPGIQDLSWDKLRDMIYMDVQNDSR